MKTIVQQIDWAEVGQIVLQGLITLAVLTYLAGWYLGRWLHRANDRLARFWVHLVVLGEAMVHTPNPLAQQGSGPVGEATVSTPATRRLNGQPARQIHCAATGLPRRPATPTAPLQHPLSEVASGLLELTAAELRSVLGTRQRCSKAQLVAAACSW